MTTHCIDIFGLPFERELVSAILKHAHIIGYVKTHLKHMGKVESRFANELNCTDRLNGYPPLHLTNALKKKRQKFLTTSNTAI